MSADTMQYHTPGCIGCDMGRIGRENGPEVIPNAETPQNAANAKSAWVELWTDAGRLSSGTWPEVPPRGSLISARGRLWRVVSVDWQANWARVGLEKA